MITTKSKNFPLLYAAGFLAYMSIYIVRLNFSIGSVVLEKDGILTTAQIGIIGSIFSFVYALSKVPAGYFGDVFPSKKVILCGLLVAAVSNLLIGVSREFLIIAVLWGLNAFGQSLLWGPLLRSFRENCDEATYLKVSRTLGISIPAGSIVGILLSAWLIKDHPVSWAFIVPALIVLGITMFAAIFLFSARPHSRASGKGFLSVLGTTFRKRRFLQIIFPAMAHGMIKDNITVWLALFFVNRYGIDVSAIAGYVFFIPLLTMLGKSSYLPLLKIFRDDYTLSVVSFVSCALCSLILCIPTLPAFVAALCLALISALIAIINTHFLVAFPQEISDEKTFSFAASIMDLLTYGGAGIGSLIFGFLIESAGFSVMFLVWAAAAAASMAVLLLMSRRGMRHDS